MKIDEEIEDKCPDCNASQTNKQIYKQLDRYDEKKKYQIVSKENLQN